jgi:aspartate ammonia-lyase
MGRTENQDAVPMTLGQEFGAYAVMIEDGIRRVRTDEQRNENRRSAAF